MLDVISGGRLIAGFPVGTSMDTNYCYGAEPGDAAREVPRGARPHHQGVARARAVRVERQVHQAPLREPVAAADPEAAPAGLGARPRLDRDLGLVHRPRLQLQLPLVQRLQARPEDDGRLLGAARAARRRRRTRTAAPSSSRCASATPTRRASASGGRTSTTSSTSACTSTRACRSAPGYMSEASMRAGVVAQVGNTSQNMGHEQDLEGARRASATSSPARRRRCASSWRSWRRSLRVGHLCLGLHIGSAPIELTNRSTYLFATEVHAASPAALRRVRGPLVAEAAAGGRSASSRGAQSAAVRAQRASGRSRAARMSAR